MSAKGPGLNRSKASSHSRNAHQLHPICDGCTDTYMTADIEKRKGEYSKN
jgi:hypothetical protein